MVDLFVCCKIHCHKTRQLPNLVLQWVDNLRIIASLCSKTIYLQLTFTCKNGKVDTIIFQGDLQNFMDHFQDCSQPFSIFNMHQWNTLFDAGISNSSSFTSMTRPYKSSSSLQSVASTILSCLILHTSSGTELKFHSNQSRQTICVPNLCDTICHIHNRLALSQFDNKSRIRIVQYSTPRRLIRYKTEL